MNLLKQWSKSSRSVWISALQNVLISVKRWIGCPIYVRLWSTLGKIANVIVKAKKVSRSSNVSDFGCRKYGQTGFFTVFLLTIFIQDCFHNCWIIASCTVNRMSKPAQLQKVELISRYLYKINNALCYLITKKKKPTTQKL